MWTYKNDYYAVLIRVFSTQKKRHNQEKSILKIEEKVGMAVKKAIERE